MEELEKVSQELEQIVQAGGFKFKETFKSGDPCPDGQPIKVLGLVWETEKDALGIDVKINFGNKRQGAKTQEDGDLDTDILADCLPEKITKRIIWRVCQAQYDPLGLLSPYCVQLKMIMRKLCETEKCEIKGWDEEVPPPNCF